MTSQIAILNHSGIALASDTVTTLGGSKTLGNSSKIFELPKGHSVVVLHNGAVDINAVNSWLLVTEWSRQLSKEFTTVESYVQSFVEWFDSSRAIHTKESEHALVIAAVEDYFRWIASKIDSSMADEYFDEDESEADREARIKKVTSDSVDESIKNASKWPQYQGLSEVSAHELIGSTPGLDLKSSFAKYFERFALPKTLVTKIQQSATYGISRVSSLNTDAELVFAGFGSHQSFAEVIKVGVRGAYGGKLRYTLAKDGVNADHPRATLMPLAQDDAINAFGRGWNPMIRNSVDSEVFNASWDVFMEIGLKQDPNYADYDHVGDQANLIRNRVMEAVDKYSLANFIHPLMDTVDAMSLVSVADLAESLIGIQAASTYSKKGSATVGGFVEVVTIDRFSGVKWRKRLLNNE